jgi:PAS domain S-box-containing protein
VSEDRAGSISAEEILAAVGVALVATDRSGSVVYWNEAAQDLYGWTAEEAVGCKVEELTAPDVGDLAASEKSAALRGGVPWSGWFGVSQKGGTKFPALATDRGIYRDGDLVGHVGLTASLGSALEPLLERSVDASVVLSSDALVTYASPSARRIFGWEEPIVGTSMMPLLHPEDRPTLTRSMEEVAADSGGARSAIELRVETAGGWVWAEASLTSMLDDAHVRGMVCTLRPSLHRGAHEAAELQVQQLTSALQSRVLIEQAKGFLAGRHGCTVGDGFERMRGYARAHRMKLQEVSRQVLAGSIDLSRD